MIDFRHETFLALCEEKSYTKTAKKLHITQPAVTQHIQYLEKEYNVKLFVYQGRKLNLTRQGKLLRDFIKTIAADGRRLKESFVELENAKKELIFGATLSIGEYVMPQLLATLLEKEPQLQIHMTVANTRILLEKLNQGELDFILVEGIFDKGAYDTMLFSMESFIAVCAKNSCWAQKSYTLEKIRKVRLILREKGSGTREIFEKILQKHNYTLKSFEKVIEIGNMAAIKTLVEKDMGITFLFQAAAQKELENGQLKKMNIVDLDTQREFNFVFLKNSFYREDYIAIFDKLKQEWENVSKQ